MPGVWRVPGPAGFTGYHRTVKLLIFSDIHSNHKALERLMDTEADYYFAAGDLANWSRGLEACGEILKKRVDQVYVLPGNHESAAQIAGFCAQFGFHNFHQQMIQIGKHHVAGLGYSSPTTFNTPGEYSEAELTARLAPFESLNPLVLICHAPPYGTALDLVRKGLHAGSQAVRDFIDRCQPEYFFCGHIHEAEGAETEIGKTKAMNVGKRGYLLELN
ncbi:MAG TPA: metallophosphoesterase [Bryobacteraceae bacterium]|nr:metallophosphoesterase [Bryobacteraceae bacterium]